MSKTLDRVHAALADEVVVLTDDEYREVRAWHDAHGRPPRDPSVNPVTKLAANHGDRDAERHVQQAVARWLEVWRQWRAREVALRYYEIPVKQPLPNATGIRQHVSATSPPHPASAMADPLTDISPMPVMPQAYDPSAWISFAEVEAMTGYRPDEITRACDSGVVRSEGKGRGRRVHAGDIARFALKKQGRK
jgi:hypothetical protein